MREDSLANSPTRDKRPTDFLGSAAEGAADQALVACEQAGAVVVG